MDLGPGPSGMTLRSTADKNKEMGHMLQKNVKIENETLFRVSPSQKPPPPPPQLFVRAC
jgi:hypothetical protein